VVRSPKYGRWLESATLAGEGRHNVTPRVRPGERRQDVDPAISPDTKTVAFVRNRRTGSSVWLVGVDGSNARVLVRPSQLRALFGRRLFGQPLAFSQPVWSPDGSQLMAEVGSGCTSLGIIAFSPDRPGVRVLIRRPRKPPWAILEPAGWSPDGSRAAYVTIYSHNECREDSFGYSALSVVSADGSRHRGIAGSAYIDVASWSDDGRQIAFDGGCWRICNLYVASADGSSRRRLTNVKEPCPACLASVPLPFAWWNGKLLIASAHTVFALDPRTKAKSGLFRVPCRSCSLASIDAVSSSAVVAETDDDRAGLWAVSLPGGSATKLSWPRPLGPSDTLEYFVIALTGEGG
jgi:dipeptidyl aminopeptidase/acylaminoacyl peptidase